MPRLSALPLALALSAATAAAQTPPPACSLDDVAVPFATPLTLLHSLAPPSALAEYPFVEVLRAARVRVDFPVGDTAPLAAYVALETAAVRLRGTAHADAVPLFPARPIRFGGLLIPLARHGLHLHGASPEGVLVAPIPAPGGRAADDRRGGGRAHACDGARPRPPLGRRGHVLRADGAARGLRVALIAATRRGAPSAGPPRRRRRRGPA